MHPEVHTFIKLVRSRYPYKFRNKRVLEVGSHIINGSPRKYFWFCDYTGVDISKGKGVDIQGNLRQVQSKLYPEYQTIICTEMLEHDYDWMASLRIMYDRLADNGLLIITCAGPHRYEHGTKRTTPFCSPDTTDYYGNLSLADFESVLPCHLFDPYVLQYERGKCDLQFYGVKRRVVNRSAGEIYGELRKRV